MLINSLGDFMNKKWLALKKIVDEQAEDQGLWFEAETAPEAYLQQELRKLHAEIENAMHTDGLKCEFCGSEVDYIRCYECRYAG